MRKQGESIIEPEHAVCRTVSYTTLVITPKEAHLKTYFNASLKKKSTPDSKKKKSIITICLSRICRRFGDIYEYVADPNKGHFICDTLCMELES